MEEFWQRRFQYDAWANDLALSSVRDQGDAGPDARSVMAHVFAAERIWLDRLLERPSALEVWPSMTLEQMTMQAHRLPPEWTSFIDSCQGDFGSDRTYRNSKGDEFTTAVVDILTHVIAHSAYHRGQIATRVRELGLTPAVTDYIVYTRR